MDRQWLVEERGLEEIVFSLVTEREAGERKERGGSKGCWEPSNFTHTGNLSSGQANPFMHSSVSQ